MPSKDKAVAVFFADSHIQERIWSHRAIEGDAYHSFRQIVDYAIDRAVPLIGAGDLIDRQRNTSDPIVFINKHMDRLESVSCPFMFVQGQHELQDRPWFNTHRSPRHIHGKLVELGDFLIYGLDFQPAGNLQQALDRIPKGADILVAHQVWGDFMGDIAKPQGGFHDVPEVSMVFTGDYHQREERELRGKDGQAMKVVSPGSTCLQAINEPADKYFYVLYDDGEFEAVRLKTRPVVESGNLLSGSDLEDFIERWSSLSDELSAKADELPSEIAKPLLRVTYSYRLEGAQRRIQNVVGHDAHIFWKELPPERLDVSERRQRREQTGKPHTTTLAGRLDDYLEEVGKPAISADCHRLLQAEDVDAELRRMREEALSES